MTRTAELSFTRDGDGLRGYAAWPADGTPAPAIVLIPDVRGVYEHFRDVTRRFADAGFFTFAIDLYSREGAPDLPDLNAVMGWMAALSDQRVLADVAGAVNFLASRPEVRADAIGITGFCMGGMYALMAAETVPRLAACVGWYGMLRAVGEHKPDSPLSLAPRLGCPYLGLFGAEDALIPQADIENLRGILTRERKTFEIQVYAGAGHAFFNDARPDAFRAQVAADAWRRAVAFFRRHLGREE